MNTKQINELVASLSCDAVSSTPVSVDWREALGEDCEGWRSFEGVECEECGHVHVLNAYGETRCNDEMYEVETDLDSKPNECEGYLCAEGPMWNAYYPVDLDCEEVAKKLTGSLCAVEFADGATGLALTGAGMDFSWEICEAFIDCGYLPPAHFAGKLPRMAGFESDARTPLILAAARVSCQVAVGWAQNGLDHIERLCSERNGKTHK